MRYILRIAGLLGALFCVAALVGYFDRPAEAAGICGIPRIDCDTGHVEPSTKIVIPVSQVTGAVSSATLTNYASVTHTHTITDVSGAISTAVLTDYETTIAHASSLAGYQTTAAMTNYATSTDPRLSDARAPTGNVYAGPGIRWTTGTDTATGTSAALSASPKAQVAGVLESMLSLSDNTTANVSTTAHGLSPKCPGGGTSYWRDDCTWGTPSGGGGGSLTAVYAIDFSTVTSITTGTSTVTTTNILTGGNGTKVIGGKKWTMANSANLATAVVNDGTHAGLYLKCNTNNSNNFDTTLTGGALWARVNDLAPGLASQNWGTMWVEYMFTTPHVPNANYEAAHLDLFYGPTYTIGNMARVDGNISYSSPTLSFVSSLTVSSAATSYSASDSSHNSYDVVAIKVVSNTASVYIGQSSGGAFPSVGSLQLMGIATVSSTTVLQMVSNEWAAVFSVRSGNTSGAADLLLKKLQILTM
jgi:hypothetical protein